MSQSKLISLSEALVNVLSGIILSIISYQLIMPYLGYDIKFGDNLIVTGYFTALGFARSYVIRRVYNNADI